MEKSQQSQQETPQSSSAPAKPVSVLKTSSSKQYKDHGYESQTASPRKVKIQDRQSSKKPKSGEEQQKSDRHHSHGHKDKKEKPLPMEKIKVIHEGDKKRQGSFKIVENKMLFINVKIEVTKVDTDEVIMDQFAIKPSSLFRKTNNGQIKEIPFEYHDNSEPDKSPIPKLFVKALNKRYNNYEVIYLVKHRYSEDLLNFLIKECGLERELVPDLSIDLMVRIKVIKVENMMSGMASDPFKEFGLGTKNTNFGDKQQIEFIAGTKSNKELDVTVLKEEEEKYSGKWVEALKELLQTKDQPEQEVTPTGELNPMTINLDEQMKSMELDYKYQLRVIIRESKAVIEDESDESLTLSSGQRTSLIQYLNKYTNTLKHVVVNDDQRARIWQRASGSLSYQKMFDGHEQEESVNQLAPPRQPESYYKTLVDGTPIYPSPTFHQIILDVERSFNDEPDKERKQQLRCSLKNILFSYHKRNSLLGYVQGQNNILMLLLRYLDEESAFWIFTLILETILPVDYYTHLMNIKAYADVIDDLIKENYLDFWKKLEQFDMETKFFTITWLINLFSAKMPPQVSVTAMDLLLLTGSSETLIYIALALIDQLMPKLMLATDMGSMMKMTGNIEDNTVFDTQQLISKTMAYQEIYKTKESQSVHFMSEKIHNIYLDSKCCDEKVCVKRMLRLAKDHNYAIFLEEKQIDGRFEDCIRLKDSSIKQSVQSYSAISSYVAQNNQIQQNQQTQQLDQSIATNGTTPYEAALGEADQSRVDSSIFMSENQLGMDSFATVPIMNDQYVKKERFLKNFAVFDGLYKMQERAEFKNDKQIFTKIFKEDCSKISKGSEDISIEDYMVQNYSCAGPDSSPICLYDFTQGILIPEYLEFTIETRLDELIIDDYQEII